MARPNRYTVDYFPHPVVHGKKMSYMEQKYQNDGYAVWFKLLEELGRTDYHYLDLTDEVQLLFLVAKCNVDKERLFDIIYDLVLLQEFNKELWGEQILVNQQFIDSIEEAYSRRVINCLSVPEIKDLLIKNERIEGSAPKKKPPPVSISKNEDLIDQILTYLNKAAKRDFVITTASHRKFIKTLIIESQRNGNNYEFKHFKGVIDFKVEQSEDPDEFKPMYLRPETLFTKTNFPKYLEEARFKYKEGLKGKVKGVDIDGFGTKPVHQ